MIPKLIVWHHLGLGDHLICNGLVHELSKLAQVIWLPTKNHNIDTVKHLYSDFPNIKVLDIGKPDMQNEIISLNTYAATNKVPLLKISTYSAFNVEFDRDFYNQVGVDFSIRWSGFRMPKDRSNADKFYNEKIKETEYALVHDTGSEGTYKIKVKNNLPVYKVDRSLDSMLDWRTIIENATEIHCIDSSFIHLADSLELNASRLYYHDLVNRGTRVVRNHDWETVSYAVYE